MIQVSQRAEIDALQKESEMPLEELLKSLPAEVLEKPASLEEQKEEESGDEADDEADEKVRINQKAKCSDSFVTSACIPLIRHSCFPFKFDTDRVCFNLVDMFLPRHANSSPKYCHHLSDYCFKSKKKKRKKKSRWTQLPSPSKEHDKNTLYEICTNMHHLYNTACQGSGPYGRMFPNEN